MENRDSILPLLIGAIFAAAVHVGGALGYGAGEEWGWWGSEPAKPKTRDDHPPEPTRPEQERPRRLSLPELQPPPQPEPEKLQVGQEAPSPVRINWISAEGYTDLVARKARFDQAAVQKTVDPVAVADAPLDPTPPVPRPSLAQTGAVVAKVEAPREVAPRVVVKPAETPQEPSQPDPPVNPAGERPQQAPAMKASKTTLAAAPAQSLEPVEPVEITSQGENADAPQVATDDSPSKVPVPAPKVESAEGEKVALTTPAAASNPGADPDLPEFAPSEVRGVVKRTSPGVKPDEKSDPDDKSMEVEGDKLGPRAVAALPLEKRVRDLLGSPQFEAVVRPAPDRNTTRPDRPVDPTQAERDGAQPTPAVDPATPQKQPSPTRAEVRTVQPRPTAAPRQEREATPVSRIEGVEVKLGKVIAREGITVNTVHPRFPVTPVGSYLANPDVEVVFDRSGKVVEAEIVKSSGYPDVDGPLHSSLYRWTAGGERLEKMKGDTFTMRIHIVLREE